jgi:hypothetical protein
VTIFDLETAHRLLPKVQALTSEAAKRADEVVSEVQRLGDGDPRRPGLEHLLRTLVEDWAQEITALGAEAKGLWLVDFDNGAGYWCWKHPEPTIEYCHSYEEGFAGRKLIAPAIVH